MNSPVSFFDMARLAHVAGIEMFKRSVFGKRFLL